MKHLLHVAVLLKMKYIKLRVSVCMSVCPPMSLWKCLSMYGFKCFPAIDSFHPAANVVLQIVEKAKVILLLFGRVLFS